MSNLGILAHCLWKAKKDEKKAQEVTLHIA